jgi:uncharacterized protein YndB with AHSA1/START domain
MLDHVVCPAEYAPRVSAIYALNEADVKAPEMVWRLLVEAEHWSSYFPPENKVRLLDCASELALGTRFRRVTVSFPMSLVVTEWVPRHRLSG